MARYIDADTIPWESFPNDFGEYHEDYVEKRVVDKMPTVDAVEVVRCGECAKRHVPVQCALWWGSGDGKEFFIERGDDFFCMYGERKEEGE